MSLAEPALAAAAVAPAAPLPADALVLARAIASGERSAAEVVEQCLARIAATDRGNHEAALKMVTMQGGVFGAHASSAAVLAALEAGPA